MVDEKAVPTDEQVDHTASKNTSVSRRRLMQAAGVGLLGSSALVARGSAKTSRDRLEIVASRGSSVEYSFTCSDTISRVQGSSVMSAETSEDTISENADGTWTANGVTSDGYGDAFLLEGDVRSFQPETGAYSLYLNGTRVAREDLIQAESHRLVIETPKDGSVEYTMTTSGPITKKLGDGMNDAESSNDVVTENADGTWTVTGLTGNGYGDTIDFEGEVLAFDPKEGSFTLYLDGQEVTVYELLGTEVPSQRLVIDTPSDGSVEYTMTTAGEIVKDLDNGMLSAEKKNDVITQNDDGTWTVSGLTGNGYGDTFEFEGDAMAFEPKAGEFSLTLEGEATTPYELIGEEQPHHKFEIVTPDDGSVEYTFTANGEIVKDLDAGKNSAEPDNDVVTQNADGTWTATGLTGNGYGDTYEIDGDIVSFSPTSGDFALYLDNQQVTVYELTGQESTDSGSGDSTDSGSDTSTATDGGAIGGGSGYGGTVARADANYVVRTASGLSSALSSASSGEIVYVAGDAVIDTGGRSMDVPSGVTLASNRGIDGAPGALLHTEETPQIMLRPKANARVTGLRLRGHSPGETVTHRDGISFNTPTYAMRLEGGDVEVDNNEVWGWPDRAISVQHSGAHIHHNYIYDNNGQGLGYGVAAAAECLIEYNYFHNNRHSVTCSYFAPGYTARYNHFSPKSVMFICDVHDPAEGDTTFDGNIIENGETRTWDAKDAAGIAGYESGFNGGTISVTDNWFFDQGSAYLDGFSEVSDSGNVYGGEGSQNPADTIPNHPGLADRPWL